MPGDFFIFDYLLIKGPSFSSWEFKISTITSSQSSFLQYPCCKCSWIFPNDDKNKAMARLSSLEGYREKEDRHSFFTSQIIP